MADGTFDNTNRGALFKNDKGDNPARPDYNGKINVEGKDFWISAWLKKSNAGNTFMSLSVTEQKAQTGNSTPDTVITDIGDEPINLDDIPF